MMVLRSNLYLAYRWVDFGPVLLAQTKSKTLAESDHAQSARRHRPRRLEFPTAD
jgi:hypothetical protein